MSKEEFTVHPEAARAYEERMERLISQVDGSVPTEAPKLREKVPIFASAEFSDRDIVGPVITTENLVNGLGDTNGRFFEVGGRRVGWTGESFQEVKRLANRLAESAPYVGKVDADYLTDRILEWLRDRATLKTTTPLIAHLATMADEAVRDWEIWVPLNETFSRKIFIMGEVEFKMISPSVMEHWFGRIPVDNAVVEHVLRKQRATLQATLAGVVRIRAEKDFASEQALALVDEACALIRFMGPANWTTRIRSFVQPLGISSPSVANYLYVEKGEIMSMSHKAIQEGSRSWNLDNHARHFPGLLELLCELSKTRLQSPFRDELYRAFLLYSKNSLTISQSEKLVFILVSLESMLLRGSSEPIQGNLAERMAFLIARKLSERKKIVRSVRDIYKIRSEYVHHGKTLSASESTETFLDYAWQAFATLLQAMSRVKHRDELLQYLDDLRLS